MTQININKFFLKKISKEKNQEDILYVYVMMKAYYDKRTEESILDLVDLFHDIHMGEERLNKALQYLISESLIEIKNYYLVNESCEETK